MSVCGSCIYMLVSGKYGASYIHADIKGMLMAYTTAVASLTSSPTTGREGTRHSQTSNTDTWDSRHQAPQPPSW